MILNNKRFFIFQATTDLIIKADKLLGIWISGAISDNQMEFLMKELSTSYPQFDLTKELPVIKYD